MDTTCLALTEGWRFHLGECEQAWYKGYDDSGWRRVAVPHDWSVEAPFSKDYSSGTGYVQGGVGWYRLRFLLPEEYRGKSVRLVFDGVYKNSQVWCNSYYLGKRPNGYTTFSYEIGGFAVFGEEENEVSVKVTHTDVADSRWFTGSGITRKVTLVVGEPVHPAEDGCFFETIGISQQRARVRVTHEIENMTGKAVRVCVATALFDREGRQVLRMSGETELSAAEPGPYGPVTGRSRGEGVGFGRLVLEDFVPEPALWSMEEPNLYRMKTWYRLQDEEDGWYLVDEEKVGIRMATFDADRGFFLNGSPRKLKGVCVHHDGGCLGAAMKAEVWQRRLELLKGCGCNAIRCSHNPHMPELYALCDAMGFVMMDEAFDEWENAKNKWSTGHNVYPPKHQGYFEDFPEWHEADLRAMVRRDRNHPSVVLYSIGNEIDYPNDPYCHPTFETMTGNNDANKPAAERRYSSDRPSAGRLAVLARRLAQIVREEDAARPVTLAAAFPELSSRLGFLEPLDVAGYNYKEQFYEEDHARFPALPLLGSENGHSYQAWRAVADHEYISGQFLWTGIDYLGEAGGWPMHGSPAGLLTTAGFVKPEWYRRRTFWGTEAGLHLTAQRYEPPVEGHRRKWHPIEEHWNYEPGQELMVRCYVNETCLPEGTGLRFLQNGRELARAAAERIHPVPGQERPEPGPDADGNRPVIRRDGAYEILVPFEAGRLTAECLDADGRVLETCSLETVGEAQRITCRLWEADDALTGERFAEAAGRTGYLYQLLLSLEDADGRDVTWQKREVRVQVSGEGELAGLDNGNLADVTPYPEHVRETFRGRLAVYVRRTGPGPIRVNVTDTKSGTGAEHILFC